MKMKNIKKVILIILIIISFIKFTYTYYNISLMGTLFILFFSYLCWPKTWLDYLGFKIDIRTVVVFFILLIFVASSSYFIIKYISFVKDIDFLTIFKFDLAFLQTIGQTLNEEIIFGGLILLSLKRFFSGKHSSVISMVIAVIFSVFHLLFFHICSEANRGNLLFLTLFNLFIFRLITNNMIIYTNHIFYAWAIHFGWNVVFLRNVIQTGFNEPKLFNTFIGSKIMLLFLLLLLLFSFFIIYYTKNSKGVPDSNRRSSGQKEKKI